MGRRAAPLMVRQAHHERNRSADQERTESADQERNESADPDLAEGRARRDEQPGVGVPAGSADPEARLDIHVQAGGLAGLKEKS